eukprot:5127347-Pyramimonas_sp.AAC.1
MDATPPPCWASALAAKQSNVSRSSTLPPLIVALARTAGRPRGRYPCNCWRSDAGDGSPVSTVWNDVVLVLEA